MKLKSSYIFIESPFFVKAEPIESMVDGKSVLSLSFDKSFHDYIEDAFPEAIYQYASGEENMLSKNEFLKFIKKS